MCNTCQNKLITIGRTAAIKKSRHGITINTCKMERATNMENVYTMPQFKPDNAVPI